MPSKRPASKRPARALATACGVLATVLAVTAVPAAAAPAAPARHGGGAPSVDLSPLGTFAGEKAEITAYDWTTRRAYVTGADDLTLDILDVRDPRHPERQRSVDLSAYGDGAVTSVDVRPGLVAATVEQADASQRGVVVLLRPDGRVLRTVEVGHSPDMVTFASHGLRLLVANEGEPVGYADGEADPEGSVSVVDLRLGATHARAHTAGFGGTTRDDLDESVRISGPGASVAQDLEPEYIAESEDGRTAYVTLQENNAVATIDIRTAKVTGVRGMGFKDHSRPGNGLDTSDQDDAIRIEPRPVLGVPMPDAIGSYRSGGEDYYVVAGEGDEREYGDYEDSVRLADLDPALLPDGFDPKLLADEEMGRLTVLRPQPGEEGGPLKTYGSRSFSIRDAQGRLVWDSGDLLEKLTAKIDPDNFNAEGEGDFDKRSDNKGPEPEGLTLGSVDGRQLAFVALERTNGVMVFDITDPRKPEFRQWVRSEGDESPEGLEFVPAWQSPTFRPMLAVAHEGSSTTTLYDIG